MGVGEKWRAQVIWPSDAKASEAIAIVRVITSSAIVKRPRIGMSVGIPAIDHPPLGGLLPTAFALPAQEVRELLHQLVRVDLTLGQRLALLAGRRVVLLLELLHVLARGAIARDLAVALGAEFLHRFAEARQVQPPVHQPATPSPQP